MPHVANEVAPADLGTMLLIQAIVVSRVMAWMTVDSLVPTDCPCCQSDVVVETMATSKLGYIFISCLRYLIPLRYLVSSIDPKIFHIRGRFAKFEDTSQLTTAKENKDVSPFP